MRQRLATARVACLATIGTGVSGLAPQLVPICFAVEGDVIYSAVDEKPKRSRQLRRLSNISANPLVCVLAQNYSELWDQLWWVRADGAARTLPSPVDEEHAQAVRLLRGKYPQYSAHRLDGPVVAIDVIRWAGWKSTVD